MRRFVRENALSLFWLTAFAVTLLGHSVSGHRSYNEEQVEHGGDAVSYGEYVTSTHFGRAMLENWQSEWLQFILFAVVSVWLVQRGSNESKEPGKEGLETDAEQEVGPHARPESPAWAKTGGWRTAIYGNSFVIVMTVIFLGSWLAQSLTGWIEYNEDQQEHGQSAVAWLEYLSRPRFWEETLQNWQSEFLAVGTMTILTVYLRQRGSPESKPVGAPHAETGTSG